MSWIFPDSGIRISGKLSGFLKSIYLDSRCYEEFPVAKISPKKLSGIRFCPEFVLDIFLLLFLFWINMEFYSLFRLVFRITLIHIPRRQLKWEGVLTPEISSCSQPALRILKANYCDNFYTGIKFSM